MALLAKCRDNGRKLTLGCLCHNVGRSRSGTAHAHVERTVVAEGKPARGLVELHRGDAEVENDAIHGIVATRMRDCLQIG
jgi:hypothetical protein